MKRTPRPPAVVSGPKSTTSPSAGSVSTLVAVAPSKYRPTPTAYVSRSSPVTLCLRRVETSQRHSRGGWLAS